MIDVCSELDAIEPVWDQLADACSATPFMRPGWFRAWWRAFGRGDLRVITVRRGGKVLALMPLQVDGRDFCSPTNDHTPRFEILARDTGSAHDLACALFARRPRLLTLEYVDPTAPSLGQLKAAAAQAAYRVVERTYERPPYVPIDGPWEDYERRLGGRVRRDVARRRRRLEEEGAVSLEVVDGSAGLQDLLEEGFQLEPSGWKGRRGTAIASRPETKRFYTELAAWARARGWLRLSFLRMDGRPVAFQYGLESSGVYYFLKGGYDPGYARFSPGKLLVYALLERAFSLGLTRYDFLGGDEAFKLEWTQSTRELRIVRAFSPTPLGLLGWTAEAHGRPLGRTAIGAMRRIRVRR